MSEIIAQMNTTRSAFQISLNATIIETIVNIAECAPRVFWLS